MQPTIGQRILAAVIAYKLGIATDRALKLYVKSHEIDPSWEQIGDYLLRYSGPTSANGPVSPRLAAVVSITRPNGNAG